MTRIKDLLQENVNKKIFIKAVISGRKNKTAELLKVSITPVKIKDIILLQFTYHYQNRQIHKNLDFSEALPRMEEMFLSDFRQLVIFNRNSDIQVKVNKKGKIQIFRNKPTKVSRDLAHDRKKNYILKEGKTYPFLVEIGVMNDEGIVFTSKKDKFRQINKFLEIVDSTINNLPEMKDMNIVDFGCGKSYLTFALHYYLTEIKGIKTSITGLDLKSDVVENCNGITKKLGLENLVFKNMDIKDFVPSGDIDMIVSLHACDTATDIAIAKGIMWNAKLILSVPCCQHELFKMIRSSQMNSLTRHGILKERLSAMITDSLRAEILEIMGYDTSIIEFIDMEHTPKNLMIRALYKDKKNYEALKRYFEIKKMWNIDSFCLERELSSLLDLKIDELSK